MGPCGKDLGTLDAAPNDKSYWRVSVLYGEAYDDERFPRSVAEGLRHNRRFTIRHSQLRTWTCCLGVCSPMDPGIPESGTYWR